MEPPDRRETEALLAQAGWLRALAHGLVGDAHVAEDLTQDTWVAAFEHPPRDPGAIRAFLSTIARNFARQRQRAESSRSFREQSTARDESVPSAHDAAERFAVHKFVVEAVESLDEPYRTAIFLRYFDDLPPREIARRLDVPVKTINTRLNRALDQLRARLDRARDGDRRAWVAVLLPLARSAPSPAMHHAGSSTPATGILLMTTHTKIALAVVLVLLVVTFSLLRTNRSEELDRTSSVARVVPEAPTSIPDEPAPSLLSSARAPLPVEVTNEASSSAGTPSGAEALELRGRVVDGREGPIEGAEVFVTFAPARTFDFLPDLTYASEAHRVATAQSDARGEFAFRLSSLGPFDVHVRAAGYAEAVAADLSTKPFVLVHVRRAAMLHGQVRRTSDRLPVAGARVIVRSDEAHEPLFDGRADFAGDFRADGLGAGKLFVQVIPDVERHRNIELELHEGEQRLLDVEVDAGSSVTGSIRDARTHQPIAGAEVSSWSFVAKIATSDAAGRYTLSGLVPRNGVVLNVRAARYGACARSIDAKSEPAATADFELTRGCVLRGRVLARDGATIEGAYVGAFSVQRDEENDPAEMVGTHTTADGRFELKDVRCDLDHVVFVRHEHFGTLAVRATHADGDGKPLDLGNLVLAPPAMLSGRIEDAAGRALADARVELLLVSGDPVVVASGQLFRNTASDDVGKFRLADLAAGKYRLRLARDGWKPKVVEVELSEGELRRDFRVVMDGELSIAGRVLDPFGRGLPDAHVWASADRSMGEVQATTAADGSFEIAGLSPRAYALQVYSGGRLDPVGRLEVNGEQIELARGALSGVEAGSKGVVIQLARAVAIQGVVRVADGGVAAHAGVVARDAQGLALDETFADENGRFRLRAPEGTSVDLSAYPSRVEKETLSGYARIESEELQGIVRGVAAGASGVVVLLPK